MAFRPLDTKRNLLAVSCKIAGKFIKASFRNKNFLLYTGWRLDTTEHGSGPFSGMWVKIALGLANTKIGVTVIIVPHIFVFFKARIGKNVADGVKFPRACGEG